MTQAPPTPQRVGAMRVFSPLPDKSSSMRRPVFRLPQTVRLDEVDIDLVGVPFDGGVTNRSGARHGPRDIRNQSSLIRKINQATGAEIAAFFATVQAATAKPAELPPKRPIIPNAKELVSLRIDRDILDHFQEAGPGWQDRINEARRKVVGK